MIGSTPNILSEQQWRERFPSTLTGLFAFYQCLCTIAIIGCEIGSILIDLFNATIYVGLWASLFFMIAWISQVIAVTCRHTRKCAKYTLIIQSITLFFAVCVIGFDAYFLIDPTACFFSLTLCNSTAPIRGIFYSQENFNNIKIPLIKGQLATATVMFAFGIDYIIIYFATRRQMKNIRQSISKSATNNTTNRFSKNPSVTNIFTVNSNIRNNSNLNDTTIESSLAKSVNHSRWSFNSVDLNPIKI